MSVQQEWISNEGGIGKSCHASTVAELPDGRIAAAWFSGTREKNPDVDIVVAIRPAGGGQFTAFTAASLEDRGTTGGKVNAADPGEAGGPVAHWNPVLLVYGQRLYLYFKIGANISRWRQYVQWAPVNTEDFSAGGVWSQAVELVPGPEGEGGRGAVRTSLLIMPDGSLLAGGSTECKDAAVLLLPMKRHDRRSSIGPLDPLPSRSEHHTWQSLTL
eukprot:SAG31_NODE_2382_length_5827_cov_1.421962_5_plen_216_part_00